MLIRHIRGWTPRCWFSWVISCFFTVALGAFALESASSAQATEPGVTRSLALARAARLSDLHYALAFTIRPHANALEGRETLLFSDSVASDLVLDFRDGTLASASLNNHAIATVLENGHLTLPASALVRGPNSLSLVFTSQIAAAGKAFTRFEDSDDKSEYVYSLFVPMDASMAFPCFDQPDLKGRFTLELTAPARWTVIGNSSPVARSIAPHQFARTSFLETEPISTYLFAFAAGPFVALRPEVSAAISGQPTVYVRRSQLARTKDEIPRVQEITARGVAYLADYFAQPFPFPKYDLVLIPGFPFGGMEHAGATFLREDAVLFRAAPTESDRFQRDVLVLHETTHQWFGDLVTMRWFDDLWLKEGFAQYMAYHAMAELEPAQQPWKHFYEDIKPTAYTIDETQGTTPIFQNIPNLKDAKSAYGAIVYQKAPALLRQLEFRLGEQKFRDGLRLYLKQHAYANAQWSDLISAFHQVSGQDVTTWADAWIPRRGMPQVDVSWACSPGSDNHRSAAKISRLTLTQEDVLHQGYVWPISNEILLGYDSSSERLKVDWSKSQFQVAAAVGKPCPRYIFANAGDHAYGRFLLDSVSESAVDTRVGVTSDALLRSMLWGSLWDSVRAARSSPRDYVELVERTLPTEEDESIHRIQGGRLGTALHSYVSDPSRRALIASVESIVSARMLHALTLGDRIVSFRTFTAMAETSGAEAQLKAILAAKLVVPGVTLRPLDRWNIIGHLVALNDPEAATLFAAEKKKDRTGDGQKYAYAIEAGTPSAVIKARYFDEYLRPTPVPPSRKSSLEATSQLRPEDWITQSLRPFNSWNQTALTEPFLTRALDALPEIKLHRKIFFLTAWLNAFIGGQNSPEAQAAVHGWLTRSNPDPDLRLKVLELSDELDRSVLIRQRFPE